MNRRKAVLGVIIIPTILVGALLFLFSTSNGRAAPPADTPAKLDAPDASHLNGQPGAAESLQGVRGPGADLAIFKFSAPTNEVLAGEQFTYTIIVDNYGPISATNVVITDTLVTEGFVDANGCSIAVRTDGGVIDEFNCNFALSTGVFDLGTFGANWLNPRSPTDMGRIIITINATAEQATDMTNIATVTSDTFDPDMSNNTAIDTLSVFETADLQIHKFSAPTNEVQAGEQFTYTIIVDNWGPGIAYNLVITDTLVTEGFVDANGCSLAIRTDGGLIDEFNCNFALSTGVFDLGTFGSNWLNPRTPSDMGRIIITINATADEATDMTNLTTVTSATHDPNMANNYAVTTLSVLATSNLEIAATDLVDPVSVGDYVTYTVVVTNNGPSVADNTLLYGTLPGDVEAVSFPGLPAGTSCNSGIPGEPAAPLTCGLGNLGSGDSVEVTVQARVKQTSATALNADFSTFSDSIEPNLGDNFASVLTDITGGGEADLQIWKFSAPTNEVQAGEQFTYTIIVDNWGPDRADNVVITDTLVTEGFVDANGCSIAVRTDGGAIDEFVCNFALSTGVFDLGTFGANWLNPRSPTDMGRVIITINATAEQATDMTNMTTVTADTFDPDTSNNTAIDTLSVTALADLNVTKTVDPIVIVAGEPLTYTVVVENDGPSTAENVTVYDALPDEVTLTGTSVSNGGNCFGGVQCNLGNLAAGEVVTVEIYVTADSGLDDGDLVQNDVWVTSDTADPNTSDNVDTVISGLVLMADLEITKTQIPENAFIGTMLEYTILITNHGPADILGATVEDIMPDGLENVNWTCESYSGVCPAAGLGDIDVWVDIPVDEVLEFTVYGTVNTHLVFTNTATVSPPNGVVDPVPGNNSASVPNMTPAAAANTTYVPLMFNAGDRVFKPDLVIVSLDVSENSVEITIENVGLADAVDPFWVDFYVDPTFPPNASDQTWQMLGFEGLAWGVGESALPLEPGETLVLTVGDVYYSEINSAVAWPLDTSLAVYAQVDSVGGGSGYGAVLEEHEAAGLPYNNIAGPVFPDTDQLSSAPEIRDLDRDFTGLPARPQ